MRLDKEARKIEETILRRARRMEQPQELKAILREALATFEGSLEQLSSEEEKQEALALYLDRIRRVTFSFHMAVFRKTTREAYGRTENAEVKQHVISVLEEGMKTIARLYRFI